MAERGSEAPTVTSAGVGQTSPGDPEVLKTTTKLEHVEHNSGLEESNESTIGTRYSRQFAYEEIVLPMTEALATLPPARTLPPRPLSEPVLPDYSTSARSSLPTVPLSPSRNGRGVVARWVQIRSAMRLSFKQNPNKKRRQIETATCHLIFSGAIFLGTSVLYIALAFSLPDFPSFLHIFFVGILFVEFCYVVQAVFRKIRAVRRKGVKSVIDGPAPGTIIQGAPNWEGLPEAAADGPFDLERIGVTDALKPIPPAYGVYRGSVRIADTDIRWVRRNETTADAVTEESGNVEVGQTVRPPSYVSDAGGIV